jgi:VanZ family protein
MSPQFWWASAWGPPVAWAGVIFWGSGPPLSSTHTSRFLVPFLRWLIPGITSDGLELGQTVVRKGGHVTEYFLLTLLLWRAWSMTKRAAWAPGRITAVAAACAVLYACSDEFHQTFVPGRQGQAQDVVIDAIGVLLASAAATAHRRGCRAP